MPKVVFSVSCLITMKHTEREHTWLIFKSIFLNLRNFMKKWENFVFITLGSPYFKIAMWDFRRPSHQHFTCENFYKIHQGSGYSFYSGNLCKRCLKMCSPKRACWPHICKTKFFRGEAIQMHPIWGSPVLRLPVSFLKFIYNSYIHNTYKYIQDLSMLHRLILNS